MAIFSKGPTFHKSAVMINIIYMNPNVYAFYIIEKMNAFAYIPSLPVIEEMNIVQIKLICIACSEISYYSSYSTWFLHSTH